MQHLGYTHIPEALICPFELTYLCFLVVYIPE